MQRQDEKGTLTKQEELELLLEVLDVDGFHHRVDDDYIVDEVGDRVGRVLRSIFFCNEEQIRLARRFVSMFMYQTDATFSTN